MLNESIAEETALEWFGELVPQAREGGHGQHLAPGKPAAKRDSFSEDVLVGRSRKSIRRLNAAIPKEARSNVRQYRGVQISTGRETMP